MGLQPRRRLQLRRSLQQGAEVKLLLKRKMSLMYCWLVLVIKKSM